MKMGASAIALAKACGYFNAGTVEFLVDEKLNYYFLEMNTRLQVEHPVTEFITGFDLVKEQIKIARGEKLSFTQDDLSIRGHAIELRVCAEDPKNNFFPDIGKLKTYRRPQGAGVRVDDGFEEGMEIPIYYDPMLAKLITCGADRNDAIERMIRAIDEFKISGVQTTLSFGKWVMQHPKFRSGEFDTNFIPKYFSAEKASPENYSADENEIASLLSVSLLQSGKTSKQSDSKKNIKSISKWKRNRLREE
jgi:acetyl/propionyl-CoA carboxylase alpha subunit